MEAQCAEKACFLSSTDPLPTKRTGCSFACYFPRFRPAMVAAAILCSARHCFCWRRTSKMALWTTRRRSPFSPRRVARRKCMKESKGVVRAVRASVPPVRPALDISASAMLILAHLAGLMSEANCPSADSRQPGHFRRLKTTFFSASLNLLLRRAESEEPGVRLRPPPLSTLPSR